MAIEITGRHVSVTDSMRDYALRKAERAVADYPAIEKVHVILDMQKYRHIAEIIVQGRNHLRVEAREEAEGMYAAIDVVTDKIARQLHRLREKITQRRGRANATEFEHALEEETAHE
jgi:putative sigma-54 modulation protein